MTITNISQIGAKNTTYGHRSLSTAISGITGGIIDEETILADSGGKLEGTVTFTKSQIRFHNPASDGNALAPLTYGNRANITNKIKIKDTSSLIFSIVGGRANIFISEISGESEIIETTAGKLYVYTQTDAIIKDCVIIGVKNLELYRSPSQFFNVTIIDTQIAMLNWEAGRIDRFSVNVPSTISTWTSWMGNGNSGNNSFWDWNLIAINQEKIVHQHTNNKYYSGYTASYKFVNRDTDENIEDVQVDYRDDEVTAGSIMSRGKYTTKADGTLEGFYDSKNRTTNTTKNNYPTLYILNKKSKIITGTTLTGLNDPRSSNNYTLDTIAHNLIVKSYGHDIITTPHTIISEKGKIGAAQNVIEFENYIMVTDSQLTQKTKSIVDAYSTIDNENQLYDKFKSYWRDTDNVTPIVKNASQLNLGAYNLIVTNASTAPVFAVAGNTITIKVNTAFDILTKITTTGTITTDGTAKIRGRFGDALGNIADIISTVQNTRIAYTFLPSGVSGYTSTQQSVNRKTANIKIPNGQTISLVAKAEGYDPQRVTLNPLLEKTIINIFLEKNLNVDLNQSLEGWYFDGEEKNFAIISSDIASPIATYFYDDKLWVYGINQGRGKIQSYDTNGIKGIDSFFNGITGTNDTINDIHADDIFRYELSENATNQIILSSFLHTARTVTVSLLQLHNILSNALSVVTLGEKFYILASDSNAIKKIFVIDKNPTSTTNPSFTTISLSTGNTNPQTLSSDGTYLYVSNIPVTSGAIHTMYVYDVNISGTDKSIPANNFRIEPNNMDTKSVTYGDNTFWILDNVDNHIYTHRGTGEYHRINSMYFQYIEDVNGVKQKSLFRVGVTNIKDDQIISKRLFDRIMTSNSGLSWIYNNTNENINLGGYPYAIRSDRIIIDEIIFDAVKIENVTLEEHSTFGITLHQKDFHTAYLPLVQNNGEVEINSLSAFYNVSQSALSRALQNNLTQSALSNSINEADKIKKILLDTDNIKDHVQSSSTLPDITTYEHLKTIDWDGAGVSRTVNPSIPNDRVQSVAVNSSGALEIIFKNHDYSEWFTITVTLSGSAVIPYVLTGNERLYFETEAKFIDDTIPIDRLEITPEIDIEINGTINGRPNQAIIRVPITARIRLRESSVTAFPKPFKFDFGKSRNATITSFDVLFKLPSTDTNRTKLILDNFRVFKSIQRSISDYQADVSVIEANTTKTASRLLNRRKVNVTTNKIEYYEDDKTTIKSTSSLKNSDGTNSSSEIFEESPD